MFRLLKWFLLLTIIAIGVMIYVLAKDVNENPGTFKEGLHEFIDGNPEPLKESIADKAKGTAEVGKEHVKKSFKDIMNSWFGD